MSSFKLPPEKRIPTWRIKKVIFTPLSQVDRWSRISIRNSGIFFHYRKPPPKKKETQNNRRLESVWYKHALFRVINRFNLEEDTGLRRKHAILEVLKHSPHSVFQRKPFDSQSSNPTEAGRLFWIGFLLVLHRPDTPEVTNVSIWLCSPVWAILLPFVFVGQGHPSKKIAWNGQWTIRWGEGGTLGNKIRGQRSGFTGSGVW